MRHVSLLLAIILSTWVQSSAEGQAPQIIEVARRAAFPYLQGAGDPSLTLLPEVDTTALGCELLAGLPLPDAIDVYRLDFPLADGSFAVQVSADGTLAQVCDQRFPNLGNGTLPVERDDADSDGDGAPDGSDNCPYIAGIAADASPGCPQSSALDRDGDGTDDDADNCPDQAGAALAQGCSLLLDEDGDGVPDHVDICRSDIGVIRPDFALGCPADGSGSSTQRRGRDENCQVIGADLPIFSSRADDAAVIAGINPPAAVIGRAAEKDWFQLEAGWVRSDSAQLKGACFNIPLVDATVGGVTGCYMRPLGDLVNVREAPAGKQVARLFAHEQRAVLGENFSGDWLFFRGGWVSRGALELAGNCDQLPTLDPALAGSGIIHFCPPGYTGYLPPRIGIGALNARIVSETLASRLRAQPDYLAEQIGEIAPRQHINAVLDGPACHGPWVWWQVEVGGLVGWTVESDVNYNYYYLEPVETVSATDAKRSLRTPAALPLPAAGSQIHSAKLDALDTVARLAVDSPQALAWSPLLSYLATITGGGDIALFSASDFRMRDSILRRDPSARASAIAFSPDERWLAVGDSEGGVAFIDLTAPLSAESIALGDQAGAIRALAWSSAGDKLAAISGDDSLKLERRAGTLKVWAVEESAPAQPRVQSHSHFPYPLTAVAFSADGRWLAVSGESPSDQRAALWVFAADNGELTFTKALVPMRGHGFVIASPADSLGDFVYSSGDSLYQLTVESFEDSRFTHHAGALLQEIAFRPQVLAHSEALMALTVAARNGDTRLQIANALSPYAPKATFALAPSAIAFSPDGRSLAAAEPSQDRILVLGVTEH